MSYAVKEIFLTLQGEGAHAGRAAVFCRFSGCNLWSGREQDRATATCRFCDTDFVGTDGTLGGRYASASELAGTIAAQWTGAAVNRYVVLTGGEPLLQVDAALIDALHDNLVLCIRGQTLAPVAFRDAMARFGAPVKRLQLAATPECDEVNIISSEDRDELGDGKKLVTDGPFAETKEQLGGYYLVEAADLDEAAAIAARIPGARFGSIEVRPICPM